MAWQYQREENTFEQVPEGKHRIRVRSAEKAISKNGNDMLALQFDVSGYPNILYHYIVFLDDRPEITNRNLTNFFDSFKDIPEGDFATDHWIGKVGACVVKKDKNDPDRTRISYFIAADKQGDLPPWKEASKKSSGGAGSTGGAGFAVDKDGFMQVDDSDSEMPFF